MTDLNKSLDKQCATYLEMFQTDTTVPQNVLEL